MSISAIGYDCMKLRGMLKNTVVSLYHNLSTIFFLLFFATLLVQVFIRYLFQLPLEWVDECSRILCVWMIFLSAAVVVDEHFVVDILLLFIKRKSLTSYKIVTVLIDLVALLVLYYMVVGSFNRTVRAWSQALPMTGLSMSIMYAPILAGTAMLFVLTLLNLIRDLLISPIREEGANHGL